MIKEKNIDIVITHKNLSNHFYLDIAFNQTLQKYFDKPSLSKLLLIKKCN